VSLEEVQEQGKNFNWKRPECIKCNNKVWGHGYVTRFFNRIKNFIFVKRWICPICGTVYTCRPKEYWQYYHESISNIFEILIYRVKHRKWPPETTRQRSGHWMNKMYTHAKLHLLLKDSLIETIIFYQQKNLSFS